jgi:hypothetical protein
LATLVIRRWFASWAAPDMFPEPPGEVALIGEATSDPDIRPRRIRTQQFPFRSFDAEAPDNSSFRQSLRLRQSKFRSDLMSKPLSEQLSELFTRAKNAETAAATAQNAAREKAAASSSAPAGRNASGEVPGRYRLLWRHSPIAGSALLSLRCAN